MPHLFTYGSLMFSEVFNRVVRHQYQQTPASVRHFKRTRIRNDSYPVVLPHFAPEPLAGVVYLDISSPDFLRLDKFEGQYYQRQRVQVRSALGHCVAAQIYVLRPKYRHLASKQPWSPQAFAQDQLKSFLDLYLP